MSERQFYQTPDGFENIPFTDEEQTAWEEHEAGRDAQLLIYKAEHVRRERDQFLKETDYAALPDTPEMSDAMTTYRQALRDVPAQSGFPSDITWPTKPEE